jgi:hypothetical protein
MCAWHVTAAAADAESSSTWRSPGFLTEIMTLQHSLYETTRELTQNHILSNVIVFCRAALKFHLHPVVVSTFCTRTLENAAQGWLKAGDADRLRSTFFEIVARAVDAGMSDAPTGTCAC